VPQHGVDLESATRKHVSGFVRSLLEREGQPQRGATAGEVRPHLSNANVQLRLNAVRLFYDCLIEEGVRQNNPVGRGRYTSGRSFGGELGLVRRNRRVPWIPDEDEWAAILKAARE
jgi:hypothetical protein